MASLCLSILFYFTFCWLSLGATGPALREGGAMASKGGGFVVVVVIKKSPHPLFFLPDTHRVATSLLSSAMPPTSNESDVFEDDAIREILPAVDESLVSDYVSARDADPGSASLSLVEGDERVAQDVEQADTSLTTSPSSALVSPVLKETLLNLPPLPPDEDDDAGCGSDDSSKDDKYIFINSAGDVKSYMWI